MEESLIKELDKGIKEADLAGRSEAVREAIREWLERRELHKKIQKEIEGYRKKPVQSDEFDLLMNAQETPS